MLFKSTPKIMGSMRKATNLVTMISNDTYRWTIVSTISWRTCIQWWRKLQLTRSKQLVSFSIQQNFKTISKYLVLILWSTTNSKLTWLKSTQIPAWRQVAQSWIGLYPTCLRMLFVSLWTQFSLHLRISRIVKNIMCPKMPFIIIVLN